MYLYRTRYFVLFREGVVVQDLNTEDSLSNCENAFVQAEHVRRFVLYYEGIFMQALNDGVSMSYIVRVYSRRS